MSAQTATAASLTPQAEPAPETVNNSDPLDTSVPLPHAGVFCPYGFPVYITSNDPAVINCADVSWGAFTRRYQANPVQLRVIVKPSTSNKKRPVPIYRAQGNLLTVVGDACNFGCCDLTNGFGFAHISKAVVSDGEFFRYHFLEGIIYTLLNAEHILTIHAACVVRNGRGVLLIGESGAGKSSFAYACGRRGWVYVSDDATSLLLRRQDRTVVGNPNTIRFRPSVSAIFPELQGHVRSRNGKPTLELRTKQFADFKSAEECQVSHLVFLKRGILNDETALLTPMSKAESRARLFKSPLPPGLDVHSLREEAVERLLSAPSHTLKYNSFGPAIQLLGELIENDASQSW